MNINLVFRMIVLLHQFQSSSAYETNFETERTVIRLDLRTLQLDHMGVPQWIHDLQTVKNHMQSYEASASRYVHSQRKIFCVNTDSDRCCKKMFLNIALFELSAVGLNEVMVMVYSNWASINEFQETGFSDWGEYDRMNNEDSSFASFTCQLEFQWPRWEQFQHGAGGYVGHKIDITKPVAIPFKFEIRCQFPLMAGVMRDPAAAMSTKTESEAFEWAQAYCGPRDDSEEDVRYRTIPPWTGASVKSKKVSGKFKTMMRCFDDLYQIQQPSLIWSKSKDQRLDQV